MLLDDPSPLVRQAMAEVFARSAEAPAAIVQALSLDQPWSRCRSSNIHRF